MGDACTPPIFDAWTAAYRQLADIMIARESELYDTAGRADGWTDWRPLTIVEKRPEAREITSFYLAPRDGDSGPPLPAYHPGQYISVQTHVPGLGVSQARQYSLSDAPGADRFRISVRRDPGPGAVSGVLHDGLNVGDTLFVSRPAGDFFLPNGGLKQPATSANASGPVVLISAGVGLTPLMAMLNSLTVDNAASPRRPISWIHGARDARDHAFATHVRALAAARPDVHVNVFHSQPPEGSVEGFKFQHAGRVDLGRLDPEKDLFVRSDSTEYYICGPTEFMKNMHQGLVERDVGPERIKMEVFSTGGI